MSKRQLAMVMDLNKCIGCQTCTSACKTQWTNRNGREYMYWNNVETAPGQGYPRKWQESGGGFDSSGNLKPGRIPDLHEDYGEPFELNYDHALMGRGEGAQPHLAPVGAPKYGPNWDEDQGEGEYPNSYFLYLPRICNHCTNPSCLAACPRQAIYKREEDGIVLIDQERCRGYQHCVAACPYKKIYFNALFKRSEKCIFCYPRIEQGLPPACANQCVGRIRFVSFLDDEEGPVHKLVTKWKVALPLHAEKGTKPNVYYVPPLSPPRYDAQGRLTTERRIPDAYLIRLFGPEVPRVLKVLEAEREKKRKGGQSELMDLLIAYRHSEMFKLDAEYYRKPGGATPPDKAAAASPCALPDALDAPAGRFRTIPIVARRAETLQDKLDNLEVAAGNFPEWTA
jgi:DMSO reductase family type II enzyme iron-sulfur subunit